MNRLGRTLSLSSILRIDGNRSDGARKDHLKKSKFSNRRGRRLNPVPLRGMPGRGAEKVSVKLQ